MTQRAIARAGIELLAQGDFDKITADNIAERAGVSVRTLFRYFPEGKTGVLLIEPRRISAILEAALRRRPPHEAALPAMIAATLETYEAILLGSEAGDSPYGFAEGVHMHREIAASNPELLSRLIGEQLLGMEPLIEIVALRMSLDPKVDIRPRLLVAAIHAASFAAWWSALESNVETGMLSLLKESLEMLSTGLSSTMAPNWNHTKA